MNLLKYLIELIGTFIFLSVILSSGEAIPIAIALAAVIFFGGKISGGNYNPAVSTMMYMNNKLNTTDYVMYVISQIVGGLLALALHNAKK